MPQLRERLCKQVYAPPYIASGVVAFTFILRGDANKIRTLVVEPALAPDFQPFSFFGIGADLFALSWVHYKGLRSDTAPDDSRGLFAYNESALINLVKDRNGASYIYIPSLYLDKSSPITSGRDAYGFPKAWGEVTISTLTPGPQDVKLRTRGDEVHNFGIPNEHSQRRLIYEAFAPASAMSSMNFITNDDQKTAEEFVKSLDDLARKYIETSDDKLKMEALALFQLLSSWGADLIFLKQYPRAQPPLDQTAYQAYVKAPARVLGLHGIGFLSGFKVRIENWDSAPIAKSYGVPPGAERTPLLGFYSQLDLEIGTGIETPI